MVRLHVKKGDESVFLYDTSVTTKTDEVINDLCKIYNGRLKVQRIRCEIEELVKHGTFLPPNMIGLTDEQVEELKLVDEWGEVCIPSGGYSTNLDPIGRRNGKQPSEKMQEVLTKTVGEAKDLISKKKAEMNILVTEKDVKDALDLLRGACMIVYPMNLPPHDPIRLEFENKEELGGTHDSLEVIPEEEAELWFCGRQIHAGQALSDFIGKIEKTKVIVKLQKRGQGAPSREPPLSEEDRKHLMALAYRKQEELKRLQEDDDDSHLNSDWADGSSLKRSFHGLRDVSWKPK